MGTHGFRMWVRACLVAVLALVWSAPLYAGPLFDEGKALYGEEKYKKAAKALKKSLGREEGTDEAATLLLSDCYLQIKKRYKAVEVLKDGATRHPDSWTVHYRLGELQEESGDLFGALSSFMQALSLKPDDLTTTFRLGMAYDSTAQIEKALEMYRRLQRAGSPLALRLLNAIQGMD